MLVDTHAHIHFDDYAGEADKVIARAGEDGVGKIICVGTTARDSERAAKFVQGRDNCWATVGLHPHDAAAGQPALNRLAELVKEPKVVAVGECGLDFYRDLSPRKAQEAALRFQIELALEHNKALVFHVREAFPEFFKIADDYQIPRAVVHCFTAGVNEMAQAAERGFYIALNGIMTFTKDGAQLEAARRVAPERLVLETDCPFLTPVPKRGQRNEPANVRLTAEFLAGLRGESFEELAAVTTRNAEELFKI